jgi:hypothetical protein
MKDDSPELWSAAFGSSYQPVKELLNGSNAGTKVSNVSSKIFQVASEISHATGLVIKLGLHAIEAAFDRCQSTFSRGVFIFIVRLLWCQAAYEVMLLCVLPRTSQ